MWIQFKKYDEKPVLSNVQRITIVEGDDLEKTTYSIVDLGIQEPIEVLSGFIEDVLFGTGTAREYSFLDNPQTTSIYNSGELGWYDTYERAKAVFDEIQKAIIAGETFYEMPEE